MRVPTPRSLTGNALSAQRDNAENSEIYPFQAITFSDARRFRAVIADIQLFSGL
jgi:hypothetical protein